MLIDVVGRAEGTRPAGRAGRAEKSGTAAGAATGHGVPQDNEPEEQLAAGSEKRPDGLTPVSGKDPRPTRRSH